MNLVQGVNLSYLGKKAFTYSTYKLRILLSCKNITYATYYYLGYLAKKRLTSFCLCGPAFGDSDDEDVPLDIALGENMDDVGGDYSDQAST